MSTPAQPRPGGGKVSWRWWAIGGGIAVLAGIGWYLYKQHQSSTAAASTAPSDTGTTDQTDYSGQLSVIQTELESLMAQEGAAGTTATGTGGSTTSTSTGTTSTSSGTSSTGTTSSGSGTTSTGSTGSTSGTTTTTGTGTTTTATKASAPPAVAGVKATKVTSTSISLGWNKAAGATSYRIRVTYQDKLVKTATSRTTSATISGLTPDHTYGCHVAAVGAGGTGPEGDVDIKTPKA